jgi:hypothetical protein
MRSTSFQGGIVHSNNGGRRFPIVVVRCRRFPFLNGSVLVGFPKGAQGTKDLFGRSYFEKTRFCVVEDLTKEKEKPIISIEKNPAVTSTQAYLTHRCRLHRIHIQSMLFVLIAVVPRTALLGVLATFFHETVVHILVIIAAEHIRFDGPRKAIFSRIGMDK